MYNQNNYIGDEISVTFNDDGEPIEMYSPPLPGSNEEQIYIWTARGYSPKFR